MEAAGAKSESRTIDFGRGFCRTKPKVGEFDSDPEGTKSDTYEDRSDISIEQSTANGGCYIFGSVICHVTDSM